MSGGSFNYLCHKLPDQIVCDLSDLRDMANRLAEIPGAEKAEKETREILSLVEKAVDRLDNCNRLRDVWQAVEWYDSHDWGMDQVQKYLEKLSE